MNVSPLELTPRTDESPRPGDASISLRSGPGAPIFEPGPNTRIRRNPVRAFAKITFVTSTQKIFGQVLNISMTGCLVKTESTIAPGTELTLSVTVLGAGTPEAVDVRGIVRRETIADGRRAYGVEFLTENRDEKITAQTLYAQTAR